ncbi:HAD family hydrolase [Microbacterium xylanilyticum]
MSAPELVVFDCDGVLVDSETLAVEVSRRVLADLGVEVTLEEIADRFVGASSEVYEAGVADLLGRALEPGWDAPYHDWYAEAFRSRLRAVPGIEESLDALVLPRCVASNSRHARIRESLSLTGLLDRFEGRIFSAEDVARGKPAPDLFLWAAEGMGVAPERCVVVEDSAFGVQAARAAGMRVLAYAGSGVGPRLAGTGTVVFDRMTDLPALIAAL